jgi:hypothetical protein
LLSLILTDSINRYQTKDAIKIFQTKYPDGVGVFVFDCSSVDEAFTSDSLLAHKMNRGPGGAQPKMHNTINPVTKEVQSMVFSNDFILFYFYFFGVYL